MGQEAPSPYDVAFNLKFKAKEMTREAKRSEKEMNKQKKKVKDAIQKGNIEVAKVFAQTAIRKKNEMNNWHKLSARLDGTASRIESAQKMKNITGVMGKVVRGVDLTMKHMDVDKISRVMDKFETQMDNLNVIEKYQVDAMASPMAGLEKEDQIDGLLKSVAAEHDLELQFDLDDVQVGNGKVATKVNKVEEDPDVDALNDRFKKLMTN